MSGAEERPRVAMILAAGRGERMRPLTDATPKPLLKVRGRTLIERHIDALVRAGIGDITVNLAWLGSQIRDYLGDGSRFGARIRYSDESPQALETAGGTSVFLGLDGKQPLFAIDPGSGEEAPLAAHGEFRDMRAAAFVLPGRDTAIAGQAKALLDWHRRHGFCPNCGSRMLGNLERYPDIVGILAGSLDDPSLHKPVMDIFTDSAHPWDHMAPDLQKFARHSPG